MYDERVARAAVQAGIAAGRHLGGHLIEGGAGGEVGPLCGVREEGLYGGG
ncbi:MAG: hypothetical protein R2709_12390 [Marmoricola sp.]